MNSTILAVAVILSVVYFLRLIIYLHWLYRETEKTIHRSRKFEHNTASDHRVLFIGDSILFGVGANSASSSIAGLFHKDNPEYSIRNMSVNKLTTCGLSSLLNKSRDELEQYKFAVVSIGGNDVVQFKSQNGLQRRIISIVNALQAVSQQVYVYTPTKPGKSPFLIKCIVRMRLQKLRSIVRQIESDTVHHVDMWDVGDKLLAQPDKYFDQDTLHLSDEGQKVWYEQLKEKIRLTS